MDDVLVAPDRVTFERHMQRPQYLVGADQGRWRLLENAFPNTYFRVSAPIGSSGRIHAWDFHFVCDNFPVLTPFIELWDYIQKSRPSAPPVGPEHVKDALKDWQHAPNPNQPNVQTHGGVYRPWQRYAAEHNNWANLRPDLAWNHTRELSYLLERLHELVVDQAIWLASQS